MNLFDADTHALYEGDVDTGRRNSLAALFDLVPQGAEVLDVGIGSGALGRRLSTERGCRVDGATISTEEAAHAVGFYRHIEVADLNSLGLDAVFPGRRYDVIICADVLEHLLRPTAVLDACRTLLKDDGVLLLSIPNVTYVGVLGELLAGEFRYRVEGLLDHTHLRFFTRRSLLRMLREAGWRVDHIETIRLELPDSEFRVSFDALPPPVQRYLLAMPDAVTYQFIVRAQPGSSMALAVAEDSQEEAAFASTEAPRFSSMLYLKGRDGYAEGRKLVAQGIIGVDRQSIRFVIPAQSQPVQALRLDPADRPGFLHVFGLRLYSAGGRLVWQWDGETASLARGAAQQILFRMPWFAQGGTALLLAGDDPFFELPLEPKHLRACRAGAVLEVELGWPMSADYALFVDELTRREARIEALAQRAAQLDSAIEQVARVVGERDRLAGEMKALHERSEADRAEQDRRFVEERDRLAADMAAMQGQAATYRAEAESLRLDVERLRAELDGTTADREALCREKEAIRADAEALREEIEVLRERIGAVKTSLERQQAANDVQGKQLELTRGRLGEIESSLAFRLVSPLLGRRAGAGLQAGMSQPADPSLAAAELTAEVDVIVPVYRGLDETRACIESVLASTSVTPYRLVVVDDASPEPQISAYLRELRDRDERVLLLENPVNVGFVGSVNRAMQAGVDRDVVLLNSDTEVAGDWLDRLRQAARNHGNAATVTPFSNSAEICSYPRFCVDSPLPDGMDTAAIDRLFAATNSGRVAEIPTAVGFCMFIRRSCLSKIGYFDTEQFGRGYGEENDFCMRARKAGWRHLLAMDVFVHHAGGVSFGEEKKKRVQQAQEVLARLHPEYPLLVHDHLQADPALAARLAVDIARIRSSTLPSVLCVLHNAVGGGTERHVHELVTSLREFVNILALRPAPGGETVLEWAAPGEAFKLGFRLPDEYEGLVATLKSLGVAHVHYHHLLGHSPSVWGLPKSLGVAHDFTAHDFYALCPQITLTDQSNRYCGERGIEQCGNCLQRSPAPGGVSIGAWRDGYRPLLEHARYVIAPSADTASRVRRYFPAANIVHAPHLDMHTVPPAPSPVATSTDRPLRIVVLGALSPIKGADLLEAVAVEAARRGLPLEFHLLGFAYRSLHKQPRARLTVHGQYEDSELPALIDWLKPDLAWFPALWPETYSYTLSACLKAGLPIVAPSFGAFAERLHGRDWTWLCPWDQAPSAWAAFFERLRVENFLSAVPPHGAAEGMTAAPSEFSYRRDYLRGLEVPVLGPLPSHEFLQRHRSGASAAPASRTSKQRLLALVVRLRRSPMLRGVARRIPLRWQTRVKVWLST